MQISEKGLKLLENQLGYTYYLWETESDMAWDRSILGVLKNKQAHLDLLKKSFDDWVSLVKELGFVVVMDDYATANCGQTTFNIMTKECLSMLEQVGFKEHVVQ